MREFRREIEVDGPPEGVWAVVTDFAAYQSGGETRETWVIFHVAFVRWLPINSCKSGVLLQRPSAKMIVVP
jgi:hypothetical protein